MLRDIITAEDKTERTQRAHRVPGDVDLSPLRTGQFKIAGGDRASLTTEIEGESNPP
jgi:hypothetical protein